MFRLIESRPQRARSRGAAFTSVLAHTGIILAVVVRTATGDPAPAPVEPIRDPIIFIDPAPSPAPTTGSSTSGSGKPSAPVLPIVAPIDIPPLLPPVGDPVVLPGDPLTYTPATGTPGGPGPFGRGIIGDSTALWADAVDRPVVPQGQPRTPRYPDLMRRDSREGSVVAFFIVGTDGRVEPGSFRAAASTHPLFTAAVRAAVLDQRFTPAEVRGQPVRQLVEQRFIFTLHR